MSTRYTCLQCDEWLSRCRCAFPRPALDDKPVMASKTWTRAEVQTLLREEADQQAALGKERLKAHLRQGRPKLRS